MAQGGLVISQVQGVTVVDVHDVSVLDASAVDALGRELYALVDQQAVRKLLLDLRRVRLMSSAMVGVLVNLHRKSQAIRGKLVICGLQPRLSEVFRIMRLDGKLNFAANEQEGMRQFDAI
jgi:anti-sigma B factor antagonist